MVFVLQGKIHSCFLILFRKNILSHLGTNAQKVDNYMEQCNNKKKADCTCKWDTELHNTNQVIPERKRIAAPIRVTHDVCTYACIDFYHVLGHETWRKVTALLVNYKIALSKQTFLKNECASYNLDSPSNSTMTFREFQSISRFCKREGLMMLRGYTNDQDRNLTRLIERDQAKHAKYQ